MRVYLNQNGIMTNNYNEKTQNKGSLFAGDTKALNSRDDIIDKKRQLAGRQALKLVRDAWESDTEKYDNIKELSAKKEELLRDVKEYSEKVKDMDEQIAAYKEYYGIEDDSEEQKDLELLEKYQNVKNRLNPEAFTEEEIERLKELQNTPLTDYQKAVLTCTNAKNTYLQEIETSNYKIQSLAATKAQAEIDMEKNQDMLNASESADEIMAAANKEILMDMIAEGKDNIDDDLEANEEKQEKIEEEQEEKAERLEEAKEQRKDQEDIIKNSNKANSLDANLKMGSEQELKSKEVQKIINKIAKENNLICEDLKGIEIDLDF